MVQLDCSGAASQSLRLLKKSHQGADIGLRAKGLDSSVCVHTFYAIGHADLLAITIIERRQSNSHTYPVFNLLKRLHVFFA